MRHESPIPYEQSRIHAAAIYCSDGRVGEHFDEFLQVGLKLPRYDRIALPGGPAALVGHEEAHLAHSDVVDDLCFLVEAHGLERIILIQHERCAFYSSKLGLSDDTMRDQQAKDLDLAAAFVREVTGLDHVDTFFLRMRSENVWFEPYALS